MCDDTMRSPDDQYSPSDMVRLGYTLGIIDQNVNLLKFEEGDDEEDQTVTLYPPDKQVILTALFRLRQDIEFGRVAPYVLPVPSVSAATQPDGGF